jgi:transposase
VTAELEAKRTSLDRLRRWLFGAPTETTRTIVRPDALAGAPAAAAGAGAESGSSGPRPPRAQVTVA